uniref:Uncharacterized protein n=1 Tax=Glossina brevipalpis TaxID=37001 RepID=A0A1A9W7Z2_9MUSC
MSFKPNVVLAHKNVAGVAQDMLRGITLVLDVKLSVMDRLVRTLQRGVVTNIEGSIAQPELRMCDAFYIHNYSDGNRTTKTLILFCSFFAQGLRDSLNFSKDAQIVKKNITLCIKMYILALMRCRNAINTKRCDENCSRFFGKVNSGYNVSFDWLSSMVQTGGECFNEEFPQRNFANQILYARSTTAVAPMMKQIRSLVKEHCSSRILVSHSRPKIKQPRASTSSATETFLSLKHGIVFNSLTMPFIP